LESLSLSFAAASDIAICIALVVALKVGKQNIGWEALYFTLDHRALPQQRINEEKKKKKKVGKGQICRGAVSCPAIIFLMLIISKSAPMDNYRDNLNKCLTLAMDICPLVVFLCNMKSNGDFSSARYSYPTLNLI
jgi:hypothetical protein